jgi:hypothetical protein
MVWMKILIELKLYNKRPVAAFCKNERCLVSSCASPCIIKREKGLNKVVPNFITTPWVPNTIYIYYQRMSLTLNVFFFFFFFL